MLNRLFALKGNYPVYNMFSAAHFMLIAVCAVFIAVALYRSRNMDEKSIVRTVRKCMWIMCIFEIVKLIYNVVIAGYHNYMSLYYCSIPLYVGWFSAYGKGKLKRMSDVFLLVGGLVGGVAYLLSPTTTAGRYPAIHFITLQSFLHHSLMIYMSILFIITDYVKLKKSDILYYILPVVVISVVAYGVNSVLGTNFMFISRNKPGTVIEVVYNMSPKLFPVMMTFWQTIPPFIVIYGIVAVFRHSKAYLKLQNNDDGCAESI